MNKTKYPYAYNLAELAIRFGWIVFGLAALVSVSGLVYAISEAPTLKILVSAIVVFLLSGVCLAWVGVFLQGLGDVVRAIADIASRNEDKDQ